MHSPPLSRRGNDQMNGINSSPQRTTCTEHSFDAEIERRFNGFNDCFQQSTSLLRTA